MAVYVDRERKVFGVAQSHLVADTIEELHAMAEKIGVGRHWLNAKAGPPYYELCTAKRELAMECGATLISKEEIQKMRRRNDA